MKIEKKSGNEERRILTGMIVDSTVLGGIAPHWTGDLFESKWSNLIGNWCIQHFEKYGNAPKKAIQSIFESWSTSKARQLETVKMVERFLSAMSGEYESAAKESNSQYTLDLSAKHFTKVRLARLADEIQGDLSSSDLETATKRIDTFGRIEIGTGKAIDVLRDQEAIRTAFESVSEPLIDYPGDLGLFFKGALERDGFIALMGKEKSGKTFMLIELAWQAMLQRRKVAFFEVGDMSQNQIMRRFMTRAAGRPLKPCKIKYPIKMNRDPDLPYAEVEYEEREYEQKLSWRKAWKACERVIGGLKTEDPLLRLSTHPNGSISVLGMRDILRRWEKDGWVADICVCDYADLLDPPRGFKESRDQINATWKILRGMSQEFHQLVITGTQTDAASYKVETVGRQNFSEDKRKFAHVTGMLGLNALPVEEDQEITRFNWVVLREQQYKASKCIHVAGCKAIGRPIILSSF